MARPKEYDRSEALNNAMLLFWEKGFERTSMQDLTQIMKISRSSIYEDFESKESLFLEALKLYTETKQEKRIALIKKHKHQPKQCIINLFTSLIEDLNRDNGPKGCLLTETITNMEGVNQEIQDVSKAQVQSIYELYRDQIAQARHLGQLKSDMSDETIAQLLLSLHEGTIILAQSQDKNHNQIEAVKQFMDMI